MYLKVTPLYDHPGSEGPIESDTNPSYVSRTPTVLPRAGGVCVVPPERHAVDTVLRTDMNDKDLV